MNVTPDIVRSEFVGTDAKIIQSCHHGFVGVSGKIIDETRNTFTILHKGKKRIIVKDLSIFSFRFSDDTIVEIDGKLVMGRPEDRLKKSIRRLW